MTDRYIHTDVTGRDGLERYIDDVNDYIRLIIETAGIYLVSDEGVSHIVGKTNGVDRLDAVGTETYAEIITKSDGTGFYSDNPFYFMENKISVDDGVITNTFSQESIDNCPDFTNYEGILSIDNVDQWKDPINEEV
jgi:hypothetical protein